MLNWVAFNEGIGQNVAGLIQSNLYLGKAISSDDLDPLWTPVFNSLIKMILIIRIIKMVFFFRVKPF